MRALVDARAFSEALSKVSKVLVKSMIPVLEGLLIQLENGQCSVTGSDFNTWLTVTLPAQGDSFAFVLQKPEKAVKACRYFEGRLLLDMCDEQPKYPVVTLSCSHRSGTFDAYPEKDYPVRPELGTGDFFITNAADLLKRVERVKYAVRAPLGYNNPAERTCVQFSGNNVFCLDGYRAACDTNPALTFRRPFMTWGNSLAYLKLMDDSEVRVQVEEKHVWLSSGTVSICCRNEGVLTFDLMRAVPTSFLEEFYVSPKEFLQELKYLEGFQSKNKSPVRFWNGQMVLKNAMDRCSTAVEIDGRSETAIGFDMRFMQDALKQFSGEKRVKIKISGTNTPIILEAEGRDDFALVLPVRLQEPKAA